jgi:hypothetical protein
MGTCSDCSFSLVWYILLQDSMLFRGRIWIIYHLFIFIYKWKTFGQLSNLQAIEILHHNNFFD